MSGIIAIDFLRVYFAEPSNARLIAVGFWVVNAAVWAWVFSLSPRRNDPRDDG
jgi:hypothetical protein